MFDVFTLTLSILALLVVGFFCVFAYYARHHLYYTKVVSPRTLSWVFLEVQMPKDTKAEEQRSLSSEERKSIIAIGEQLFTTISSVGKQGWFLLPPQEYISFEIACTDKKISFYINCPASLRELVEKQIHAQYPHAFIDEVEVYNPFPEGAEVEAAELELTKSYMYPLRTYKAMESDPLNAVTNAMSKLLDHEAAAVQIIVSPAGTAWQSRPRRIALEIQQGKNPDSVGKGVFGKLAHEVGQGLGNAVAGGKDGQSKKDLSGMDTPIHLTPMQQEIVKRLEEKASRPGFKTNIRVVTASTTPGNAKRHLSNLTAAFLQFNMPPFNALKTKHRSKGTIVKDYIFRIFRTSLFSDQILNTEELTSLWHLPGSFLETPNIKWLVSKKAPPPINLPTEGLLLGRSEYRGQQTQVRQAPDDRRRHTYIIGRTGVGKTEIMKNMAVQDMQNGEGLCVVDPHGDFIEDILPHVPKERAEDVILFEPADTDRPLGLNMLEAPDEAQKDFAVQEMISIFYKLVTDPAMLGPMFEHNMRNAMLTLMADEENPGTLVDIPRIFTDTDFQKYKVSKLKDPLVRAFWEKEMAKTSDFHKSEMLGYLVSKVGRFVENGMVRNIVGQPHSSFNFRQVMDEGKILLVNLSKGRVGEMNAKLLGLIVVSKLQMAALSRADVRESERKDFYLYVDEFQNFITDAFESILSEARKYKLSLIIAHQYLAQLEQGAGAQGAGSKSLRDAVFGNAGSMISFRIGVEDAESMAKEMAPTFNEFDLVNVEKYNGFVKLMINGTASKPFNMATYPLPKPTDRQKEIAEAVRQLSRLKYGRPKAEVEREVMEASMVADMMAAGPAGIEKTL